MLTMNIKIFSLLLAVLPATALAQEYASAFNTLRLPASSHAAALGGQNVTLIEDEPTAGWYNPALYANVSDLSAGLDFMTYAAAVRGWEHTLSRLLANATPWLSVRNT